MRRFWISLLVLLFIFTNFALAERTVYADQGGVAVFMEDGEVGLVDAGSEIVLPAEYEWIEPFADRNVAIVHRKDKMGLVRRDGSIVIPCEMRRLRFLEDSDFVSVLSHDHSWAWLFDTATGKTVIGDSQYDHFELCQGRLIAERPSFSRWDDNGGDDIYDLQGNLVLHADGNVVEYADGLAIVTVDFTRYDLIDEAGNVLMKDMTSLHLENGCAFYTWREENSTDPACHFGVRYADGTQIEQKADVDYAHIQGPEAPYCVWVGEKHGYMDEMGALMIPPIYDNAFAFVNGAAAVREGDRWYLIDTQGQRVGNLEWQWQWPEYPQMDQPVIPVGIGEGIRLIDRTGAFVNDEVFVGGGKNSGRFIGDRWFMLMDHNAATCLVDGRTGDVARRVHLEGWTYYPSGAFWAQMDGLWGQLNLSGTSGDWVIEPCATMVNGLEGGGWQVNLSDGTGVCMDLAGQVVGPAPYMSEEDEW